MTDMPQMIALYNGMGGGAAAAIAAVELYGGDERNVVAPAMAAVGGFIGAVSFSGSLIAFGKAAGADHQVRAVRRPEVFQSGLILLATAALGVHGGDAASMPACAGGLAVLPGRWYSASP